MKTISRDPFARAEIVRETLVGWTVIPNSHGFGFRLYECDWCGRVRTTRCGHPFAYRYGTQLDGLIGRPNWHNGRFCSKPCHDAYHGGAS